jgi:hypothetical protein
MTKGVLRDDAIIRFFAEEWERSGTIAVCYPFATPDRRAAAVEDALLVAVGWINREAFSEAIVGKGRTRNPENPTESGLIKERTVQCKVWLAVRAQTDPEGDAEAEAMLCRAEAALQATADSWGGLTTPEWVNAMVSEGREIPDIDPPNRGFEYDLTLRYHVRVGSRVVA